MKFNRITEGHWETTDNLDKRYVDDPEDRIESPAYIIYKVYNTEYDNIVSECKISSTRNGLAYEIKKLLESNLKDNEIIETSYEE